MCGVCAAALTTQLRTLRPANGRSTLPGSRLNDSRAWMTALTRTGAMMAHRHGGFLPEVTMALLDGASILLTGGTGEIGKGVIAYTPTHPQTRRPGARAPPALPPGGARPRF